MQLLSHKTQRARNEYRCWLCARTIEVGETYIRQFMVDGGETWQNIECRHCAWMVEQAQEKSDLLPGLTYAVTSGDGYSADDLADWEVSEDNVVELMVRAAWRNGWALGFVRHQPSFEWFSLQNRECLDWWLSA